MEAEDKKAAKEELQKSKQEQKPGYFARLVSFASTFYTK